MPDDQATYDQLQIQLEDTWNRRETLRARVGELNLSLREAQRDLSITDQEWTRLLSEIEAWHEANGGRVE